MLDCCCDRQDQGYSKGNRDDPDILQKRPPSPRKKKDKSLQSKNDVVARDELLNQIESEVDDLFKTFDKDGDGTINTGKELDDMITALKQRGYAFGRRMVPGQDYFPEKKVDPVTKDEDDEDLERHQWTETDTSCHEAVTDDSCYQTILTARVKLNMLPEELGLKDLSKRDFHDWLLFEVCSRRTNLRILLRDNQWLNEAIVQIFENIDEDIKGKVLLESISDPLRQISLGLGEPPPDRKWIKKFLSHFKSDGQLEFREFKHILVEAATRLFHSHFNESMHPHHLSSLGGLSPRKAMTPRRSSSISRSGSHLESPRII
eukprot:gnl/MRDRNA2_/MRDRNA2_31643_c0_seq1.p1 gnl/MRDRNA2_/MRDRNA2_31643_c0~~gnl/MRDRNA2_/MRDRNA2_31643_c0_seq1.p1  ORF type:complete len:318 (-),score=59.69 gnl/MRDRNA2_/MRDRNA2_31643_c0_seq1:33-986(-)